MNWFVSEACKYDWALVAASGWFDMASILILGGLSLQG